MGIENKEGFYWPVARDAYFFSDIFVPVVFI